SVLAKPAGAKVLERTLFSPRISVRLLRDELPLTPLPQGRTGQARCLFHSGVQPAVDQSGRIHLDGGLTRRKQSRFAHRPHPYLERDRVLCRLRAADGTLTRTPRFAEPGDPCGRVALVPPAGLARVLAPAGKGSRVYPPSQSWRGVGGRRVLD